MRHDHFGNIQQKDDTMKGRQKGRPTKYVKAQISETFWVYRTGIQFEVWEKWKQKDKKVGTLIVSVGGLRWKPSHGKLSRQKTWDVVSNWLNGE
jgi:hypothetical protein